MKDTGIHREYRYTLYNHILQEPCQLFLRKTLRDFFGTPGTLAWQFFMICHTPQRKVGKHPQPGPGSFRL